MYTNNRVPQLPAFYRFGSRRSRNNNYGKYTELVGVQVHALDTGKIVSSLFFCIFFFSFNGPIFTPTLYIDTHTHKHLLFRRIQDIGLQPCHCLKVNYNSSGLQSYLFIQNLQINSFLSEVSPRIKTITAFTFLDCSIESTESQKSIMYLHQC